MIQLQGFIKGNSYATVNCIPVNAYHVSTFLSSYFDTKDILLVAKVISYI